MSRLENYVLGRWEAGSPPTVRKAAQSLREGTMNVYHLALDVGLIPAGNLGCPTGDLTLFPSRQMMTWTDSQLQDLIQNTLQAKAWFRTDDTQLTWSFFDLGKESALPIPEMTEEHGGSEGVEGEEILPVQWESLRESADLLTQTAPTMFLDAEEQVPGGSELEGLSSLQAAERFYRKTIPNRGDWELNEKHPFQLPVEAYEDWRAAHLESLNLAGDRLIPKKELFDEARRLQVSNRSLNVLTGDEAGHLPPSNQRFQSFRHQGRKFFTSSTLLYLKEASILTYKRPSWIR